MARYIDAEEALRMMKNSRQDCPYTATKKLIWNLAHDSCTSCIMATETADVVEVKHGEWKQNSYCERIFYCSECNRHIEDATKNPYEHFPYCHCGAKMDGGKAE